MFDLFSHNFYLNISLAHWFVILSAMLSLSGSIVYILDMLKGKSKPNLVTWGLWAFAPFIATGAAVSAGADFWVTIRTFVSGFGPLLVFVSAVFISQSHWRLTINDYLCGLLSLIALGFWLFAKSPILAIVLALLADFLATLPTVVKAWRYPKTETVYTHFVGLFTASLVIPAITVWNIQNSAFQIYLLTVNTVLFFVVIRGRFQSK